MSVLHCTFNDKIYRKSVAALLCAVTYYISAVILFLFFFIFGEDGKLMSMLQIHFQV